MTAVRSITVAVLAATLAGAAATATNATTYEVTPCDDSAAVNLWSPTGTLSTATRGIECPGSSAAPSALPAGPRGVYVLQPLTGLVSSVRDPFAAWRLDVPSTLRLVGGTLRYRTGATTRSWRSWVTADDQPIAGCWPEADTGVDACPFDVQREQFERAGTVTVPAGARTLTVGLQCSSVDGRNRPTTACSGSDPALINAGWVGVTGGTLTVEDTTPPTGTATINAPGGWRQRADVELQAVAVDVDDLGRGVCVLELQDAATGAVLARQARMPQRSAWRQCDGLQTVDFAPVGLPGDWPEGARRVTLTAADGEGSTANRTVVTEHVVRVDDTPPTITAPRHPAMVAAGTTIAVHPAVDDPLSGVATQESTVTDSAGRPIPVDDAGRVAVPAGVVLTVTSRATDNAGNTATVHWTVGGAPLVVGPPDVPGGHVGVAPHPPADGGRSPLPPSAPAPAPVPSRTVRRCQRTAIRSARRVKRSRKVTIVGCSPSSRRAVRLQLRVSLRGRRKVRTFTVRGTTWRRVIRLRRNEAAQRVRTVGSSWRLIVVRR